MPQFESNLYIVLCRNVALVLCVGLAGLAYSGVPSNVDRTTAGIDAKTARLARRALPTVVADSGSAPIKIMSSKGGVTVSKPAPVVAAVAPVQKYVEGPEGPRPAETLFTQLGCKACHGPGSLYAAKIVEARPKPEQDLAVWILNPQKIRPGVQMPPFEAVMSENEAVAMAKWIKEGNPQ